VITTRRQFLGAGAGLAAAAGLGTLAPRASAAGASIKTSRLEADITLLDGAGCNVLAMKGPQGSLLVDGGYARNSKALLAAASKATGNKQVATLINTHWHPAQTGSNEAIGRAGGTIIAHEETAKYLARPIASVDYEGLYGPLAKQGRPTVTTRTAGAMEFAGQQVEYGYLPAAHTNGDLYIHLPGANIIAAGGPVQGERWPIIDYRNGAWLGGLVKAYEKLAQLARPDTRIVPANGRVISGGRIQTMHRMFAAFHEQMVAWQNRGWDSSDCIAARPLQEFEAQYGDPAPFIHGAFLSLNLAYSPD
jgi:glyoxylase-like metal-dependent hydrolase (beta-lactamase superfamily II)